MAVLIWRVIATKIIKGRLHSNYKWPIMTTAIAFPLLAVRCRHGLGPWSRCWVKEELSHVPNCEEDAGSCIRKL